MSMQGDASKLVLSDGGDTHHAEVAVEQSSRLLAIASGVAAAVGVASLGLAYVATQAGLAGQGLAGTHDREDWEVPPAAIQVRQVVSSADVVVGEPLVRVKVQPPAPEHKSVPAPASVPATTAAAVPDPDPATVQKSGSKKDGKKRAERTDSRDSSGSGSAAVKPPKQPHTPQSHNETGERPSSGGGNESPWWDGSDAYWDWGWDGGWSNGRIPNVWWLPPSQQTTATRGAGDSHTTHPVTPDPAQKKHSTHH